jgi:hypothetical protein
MTGSQYSALRLLGSLQGIHGTVGTQEHVAFCSCSISHGQFEGADGRRAPGFNIIGKIPLVACIFGVGMVLLFSEPRTQPNQTCQGRGINASKLMPLVGSRYSRSRLPLRLLISMHAYTCKGPPPPPRAARASSCPNYQLPKPNPKSSKGLKQPHSLYRNWLMPRASYEHVVYFLVQRRMPGRGLRSGSRVAEARSGRRSQTLVLSSQDTAQQPVHAILVTRALCNAPIRGDLTPNRLQSRKHESSRRRPGGMASRRLKQHLML